MTLPNHHSLGPRRLSNADGAALDYYVQVLGPLLIATFPCFPWLQTVMRLRTRASFVHAATLGLVSTYQARISTATGDTSHLERALSYNTKAMVQLRQYIGGLTSTDEAGGDLIEAVLLTCLLFTASDLVYGERIRAIVHFRKGLELLGSCCKHEKLPRDGAQQLNLIYQHLNGGFGQFPVLPNAALCEENWVLEIPAKFVNLSDASRHLEFIITRLLQVKQRLTRQATQNCGHPLGDLDVQTRTVYEHCILFRASITRLSECADVESLKQDLTAWTRNFEQIHQHDIHIATRLASRSFFPRVLLEELCYRPPGTYATDFNAECCVVLETAERYRKLVLSTPSQRHPTVESDLLMAVYYAGITNRNPLIRNQALAILREGPRWSVWPSCALLSSAVARVIELEEYKTMLSWDQSGAIVPRDVPDSARLQGVRILCDPRNTKAAELLCGWVDIEGRIEAIREKLSVQSRQT